MLFISLLFIFLASALFLVTILLQWQSLQVGTWLKVCLLLVLIALTLVLGYLTLFALFLGYNS